MIFYFLDSELNLPLDVGLKEVIVLLVVSIDFFKEFFLIKEPFLSFEFKAKFSVSEANEWRRAMTGEMILD